MSVKAGVAGRSGLTPTILLAASVLWIAFDFIYGPSAILPELLIYRSFSHTEGILGLGHLPRAVSTVLAFVAPVIDAVLIGMLVAVLLRRSTASTRRAIRMTGFALLFGLMACAAVDGCGVIMLGVMVMRG